MHLLLLAQAQAAPFDLWSMMVPISLTIGIFYFFLIRPESKRRQELQDQVTALKKYDRVLTTGGIVGVVWAVKDNEIVLQVDEKNQTRIRFVKSAIVSKLSAGKDSKDAKDSDDAGPPVTAAIEESKDKKA